MSLKSDGFTIRHDRLSETDDGQKQMITAHVTITKDGRPAGMLYPAALVLSEPRDGADDRSGDHAVGLRRPLYHPGQLYRRGPDDIARHHSQSVGELDLVWVLPSWPSVPVLRCCQRAVLRS